MAKRDQKQVRVENWIRSASTPVYVVDSRRHILFFNDGCAALTGVDFADLAGRVCSYASDSDPADKITTLINRLCPPPEAFAGKPLSVPAYLIDADGRSIARRLNFIPLHDSDGRCDRILAVVTPFEQSVHSAAPTATQRLHAELAALRAEVRATYGSGEFVSVSRAMQRIAMQISIAQQSFAPVCLVGESGTGREHAARMIHYGGSRRNLAFVPLDCRMLSVRELKQAIRELRDEAIDTPAQHLRSGTVYFANLDAMPRDVQAIVFEEFLSTPAATPPIRIMSSCDTDPVQLLTSDRMCDDLYYSTTSLTLQLPPLRQRMDDLQLLSQHFIERGNNDGPQQLSGLSDDVQDRFRLYHWPGNLDELRLVIEEARARCDGTAIHIQHLPPRFRTGEAAQAIGPPRTTPHVALETLLADFERQHITAVLIDCKYLKSRTAETLGISRARLYRRMQALGIQDSPD